MPAGLRCEFPNPQRKLKGNPMKLLMPTMAIRNAEGPHWLVSFDHDFGNGEMAALTVKVLKTDKPLSALQKEAFDRATELLQIVSRKLD